MVMFMQPSLSEALMHDVDVHKTLPVRSTHAWCWHSCSLTRHSSKCMMFMFTKLYPSEALLQDDDIHAALPVRSTHTWWWCSQSLTCRKHSCTMLTFSLVEYRTARTISYSVMLCSSPPWLEWMESTSCVFESATPPALLPPPLWSWLSPLPSAPSLASSPTPEGASVNTEHDMPLKRNSKWNFDKPSTSTCPACPSVTTIWYKTKQTKNCWQFLPPFKLKQDFYSNKETMEKTCILESSHTRSGINVLWLVEISGIHGGYFNFEMCFRFL